MNTAIIYTACDEFVTFKEVADLYESVGFGSSEFYLNDIEFKSAFFAHGSYRCFAFGQNKVLIGMARVFSDNKICSWIAELCVHPEWRNHGVGNGLLDMVLERSGHTAIYVEALSGVEGFYSKRGINPKKRLVACSRAGRPNHASPDSIDLTKKMPGAKC